MRTAVDSSVLLDLLTDDPQWAEASGEALGKARAEGSLIIGETVVAEIRPVLPEEAFADFLDDWEIRFVPGTLESASLAGEHFARYLRRNPKRNGIVPDFLIGAHAQFHADRLLARDRGYLRDYFRKLKVWIPGRRIH